MSDSNGIRRDQAQLLRDRMNENSEDKPASMDMLALPPRSKVHKEKDEKMKTKVKLKYPMVRFLALLFVLLPIAILGYTYYQNNQTPASKTIPKTTNESSYKEEISLDSSDEEEEANETIETKKEENGQSNNEAADQLVEEERSEDTSDIQKEETGTSPEINEENYDIVFHTVKNGDTLYSISQHYYNSRSGEKLIKKWNGLKSNEVKNGSVLKIPLTPSK